jgi:hypothetical protein
MSSEGGEAMADGGWQMAKKSRAKAMSLIIALS